jgi:signal transduction histidine kinase
MSSASGTSLAPFAISRDILHDVAHELRQPLSAIESIAYYLKLTLPREDGTVYDQLLRLQQLVEQSDWILSNALHVTDALAVAPDAADLEELLKEVISSRGWGSDRGFSLDLAGNLPQVQLDPVLGRALVGNLLTLFRQLVTESYPAVVRTLPPGEGVSGILVLEMESAVPGYSSETMLGPGGALSLESARKIIAAHGGSLEYTIDPAVGIRVRVTLP